jgi:outer membrane receptor protein involved in Fe transport
MPSGRIGFPLLAILSALLALGASTAFAASDAKSRFDLPAEPLDKALQDFAIQMHWQISYEPSLVAGMRAPAIKGEFTPGDALSMLLKGTKLRAVYVGEDIIQVLERSASASQDATGIPNSNTPGGGIVRLARDGSNVPRGEGIAPGSDQTASGTGDNKDLNKEDIGEIVVTGTHIRGVSPPSPLIEIGREEIDRSGYTSIGDLMQSLPQNFGGGYSPAAMVSNSPVNSRYGDNPTGASVPNLRGLGPGSTLTLVDGHRMASGLPGGGADISSIPIDAIERIEVVTDSASAIYGSEAVAGVVNIILKRNYDGAETSLSYGLAPAGGGTEKRVSQLFGTRWGGGDVLIAYEHRQQDAVDARDRKFTSTALEPDSLLPQTKSNSVTLSATQDLSTSTAAFVDGLYIARDANHFISSPYYPAAVATPSTLRKYAVAAGLNFNFLDDWKATLFANVAEDATIGGSIFLTAPAVTPAGDEHLLGTMRGVEANANGAIATLPTGIVRLAVGAGYRKEGFSDAAGLSSASLNNQASGNRHIRYAFGELSMPLVRHSQRPGLNALDLVVSGRNERYSDFGTKTVPKVGLVYVPTSSLKLRATWGKAFRAPNLYDTDGIQQLVIEQLPNANSPTGSSPVLDRIGGNPNLRPETASAWSIGADYSPPELGGLQVSTTFFDIRYRNRISSITNPFAAVTDPLNAFFVTLAPSPGLIQSIYGGYPPSAVFNETGAPFDPRTIGAIVDARMVNVASQTVRGADLNMAFKIGAGSNSGLLFLNGTYLDLIEQDTPQAPAQTLSGLAFYPAKFRTRGGATWKLNSCALTGTVNYLPGETNNQVTPFRKVGSWTTVDASLRYAPVLPGILSGIHFSVAVLNAFDRAPPFVQLATAVTPGLNYDSSNTNPMGRFVSLQISKEW